MPPLRYVSSYPLIKQAFQLQVTPPHIDLMSEARWYGYSGGLKMIEKTIGFRRPAGKVLSGSDAVSFWKRFETEQDENLLQDLLIYNEQDVRALKIIATHLYRRSYDSYPASLPALP